MVNRSFVVNLADIQPLEADFVTEETVLPDIREEVTLKGNFNLLYNDRTNNFSPSMTLEFTAETLEFFKKALNHEELNIAALVDAETNIITVSVN